MNEEGLTYETRLDKNKWLREPVGFLPLSNAFFITLEWINPVFVLSNSSIPPLFEDFKFPC